MIGQFIIIARLINNIYIMASINVSWRRMYSSDDDYSNIDMCFGESYNNCLKIHLQTKNMMAFIPSCLIFLFASSLVLPLWEC